MKQDMRFGTIREKHDHANLEYMLDDKKCPDCHYPTEVGTELTKRYCTNRKCNALIVEW